MSARIRGSIAGLAAAVVGAWPSLALACAACGVGNGRNRAQFFWTTVFLSLLPPAVFVGIAAWLLAKTRGKIREEFEDRDEALLAEADAIRAGLGRTKA